MGNWAKPALDGSDPDINILSYLDDRLNDLATAFSTLPSNQPDGTIRWDSAASCYKKYNSSTGLWTAILLAIAGGGTGASDAAGARTALGLGSMAVQASSAVSISGGSVASSTLDGLVPTAKLGTGTANAGTYLRGDQSWAAVSTGVPTGSILLWAAAAAPTGYLLCDGAAISRSTYAALFALIGITYGAGDGGSTFNVPDFRERFPLGKTVAGIGAALGEMGGNADHVHSGPSHTHDVVVAAHTHTGPYHYHAYSQVITHTHGVSISDAGHAHSYAIAGSTFGAAVATEPDYNAYRSPSGAGTTGSTTTGITASTVAPAGAVSTGTTDAAGDGNTGSGGGQTVTSTTGGTGNTGTNNPPYLTVNYIIKF